MFQKAGLPHADRLDKVPNSRRALILAELARERGVLDALHPRLFAAYWAQGRDLGDEHVLIAEGATAGLDADEIIEVLGEGRYLDQIEGQTREAVHLGVTGVPAWVIDERVLVPGAQPEDVFSRVLDRLGHTPRE